MAELRNDIRPHGATLRIVKNTLARIAAERAGVDGLEAFLTGPTALALCGEDPVPVAKALSDYARTSRGVLEIRGGLLDGAPLDAAGVEALAKLPSREVIFASLLGTIQAPAGQLVRLINEPGSRLARLVRAREEQLQAAA